MGYFDKNSSLFPFQNFLFWNQYYIRSFTKAHVRFVNEQNTSSLNLIETLTRVLRHNPQWGIYQAKTSASCFCLMSPIRYKHTDKIETNLKVSEQQIFFYCYYYFQPHFNLRLPYIDLRYFTIIIDSTCVMLSIFMYVGIMS